MTIYYINTGSSANKGDGDTLRTAFNKINTNFQYVGSIADAILSGGVAEIQAGQGITIDSPTGIVTISATTATASILGSVKIGNGISIDDNGIISVVPAPVTTWATLADVNNSNGPTQIAIGQYAGQSFRHNPNGGNTVSIGNQAGYNGQGSASVAIGHEAGYNSQGAGIYDSIAIGYQAGHNVQNRYSVAIGHQAGYDTQGGGAGSGSAVAIGLGAGQIIQDQNAVAIGAYAGQSHQGGDAVAIGGYAGTTNQGINSVALGFLAGTTNQGEIAVAIGYRAGTTNQPTRTIILNATGSEVDGVRNQTDSFYVAPIRNDVTATNNTLYYNPSTYELTYGPASVSQLTNGPATLSFTTNSGLLVTSGFNIIGYTTGAPRLNPAEASIAVGFYAGNTDQDLSAIAIGHGAGQTSQGAGAIAIGKYAGSNYQTTGSIIINANAGGRSVDAPLEGLYIAPIRNDATATNNTLYYNTTTFELTYGPAAAGSVVQSDTAPATANTTTLWYDTVGGRQYIYYDNSWVDTNPSIAYTLPTASTSSIGGVQIGTGISIDNSGTISVIPVTTVTWATLVDVNNANGPDKIALGTNAGATSQSSSAVAIGNGAGNLTQGVGSVAIGNSAGQTTQGNYAVSIGLEAGGSGQHDSSVAVGQYAGQTTQGESAVAIGNGAGANTQSNYAIAIGNAAGNVTQGQEAVAIGIASGQTNQGMYAVAIGSGAGQTTQGSNAVAFGPSAGQTMQGDYAVAIGLGAGQNTQTIYAVAIGTSAGNVAQGNYAVAIGVASGNQTQGACAVAAGPSAGQFTQGASAVAIGDTAGIYTQGQSAVAIGQYAGQTTQGTASVAIGNNAGATTQSSYSVAIGPDAGSTNQGGESVAIGSAAGGFEQGATAIAIGGSAGTTAQGEGAISIGYETGGTYGGAADIPYISGGFLSTTLVVSSTAPVKAGMMVVGTGYTSRQTVVAVVSATWLTISGLADSQPVGTVSFIGRQNPNAIAIGNGAGSGMQRQNAIAIGAFAGGQALQETNSIIINATGVALENTATSGLFIAPIRESAVTDVVAYYNTSTKEVTYGPAAPVTTSTLVNGLHTLTLNIDGALTTNGTDTNVYIETVGTDTNHLWTFDSTGTIVFPDGTQQTTAYKRTTGSWTIAAGTGTYSITVPANGVYQIWVRGNIDNGILSYVATAHVTNPNVPVIGSQRGYNYTDGGSPILLTSMPSQFIGTEGTIATGSIAGTTNNVFEFGISNSSGSTQTVYWGYVTL